MYGLVNCLFIIIMVLVLCGRAAISGVDHLGRFTRLLIKFSFAVPS